MGNIQGYNERLFSRGLRRRLHLARFNWLRDKTNWYKPSLKMVVELGCFDGRALDFLGPQLKRGQYVGYDANWEGGLDAAKEKFALSNEISFVHCRSPDEFRVPLNTTFAFSLETLEHIEPVDLDEYLENIAKSLNGYFFVTVPNEHGILFFFKQIAKVLFVGNADKYSLPEFVFASLGATDRVARDQHKGFNWKLLRDHLSLYFDEVEVKGIQIPWLPPSLSPSIGLIFHSKQRKFSGE